MCKAQVRLMTLRVSGGSTTACDVDVTWQCGMVAVMVAVKQMAASCCGDDMTAGWSGLLWQLASY